MSAVEQERQEVSFPKETIGLSSSNKVHHRHGPTKSHWGGEHPNQPRWRKSNRESKMVFKDLKKMETIFEKFQ